MTMITDIWHPKRWPENVIVLLCFLAVLASALLGLSELVLQW